MKITIYRIWQCTWGMLQTFLGLIMFIIHFKFRSAFVACHSLLISNSLNYRKVSVLTAFLSVNLGFLLCLSIF